jgi:hypothetical protein
MEECKKKTALGFITTIRPEKRPISNDIRLVCLSLSYTSSQQSDAFPMKLNKTNEKFLDSVYNNKPL